jgi:hypothetical protein
VNVIAFLKESDESVTTKSDSLLGHLSENRRKDVRTHLLWMKMQLLLTGLLR